MKKWTLILLCAFLAFQVFAQDADWIINQPVIQRISTDQGLSQSTINAIVEDDQGFIWFGTQDGLNRYDGYEVTVFRNKMSHDNVNISNFINDIQVDKNGVFWLATENGITRFDPNTLLFTEFEIPGFNLNISVHELEFDIKGTLWFLTDQNQLVEVDTLNLKQHIIDLREHIDIEPFYTNEKRLRIDGYGDIWIGGVNGSLIMYDTEKDTVIDYHFREKNGNIKKFHAGDIVISDDHKLYIATIYSSVLIFDPKTEAFVSLMEHESFVNAGMRGVTSLDLQGDTLWLGLYRNGLAFYNIREDIARTYYIKKEESDLLDYSITEFFIDSKKNLWMGTNGRGVELLGPYAKQFYSIVNDKEQPVYIDFNSVRSIYEDEESVLWVGGYEAMQRIDLKNLKSEKVFDVVAYTIAQDPVDKNILWLGTEGGGIVKFNKRTNNADYIPYWDELKEVLGMNLAISGFHVYELLFVNNEELLMGSTFGMLQWNVRTNTVRIFENNPLNDTTIPTGYVMAIYKDERDDIWVGTSVGELAKFDLRTGRFDKLPISNLLNQHIRINCIKEDSNERFWLGTNLGLVLLDRDTKDIRLYDVDDGLPNNVVYGILEDKDNHLWLSTNLGLSRFLIDQGIFLNYDKEDGLISNEFNTAAFYQPTSSRLYFGGVGGLIVFNPDHIKNNPVQEKVYVSEIMKFENNEQRLYYRLDNDKIVLEPGSNSVYISFTTQDYYNPASCEYMYTLNEKEGQWVNLRNNRSVYLNDLSPGTHRLSILASNSDGIWMDSSKVITIILLPYFYETTLFKVAIVFGGVLIIIAALLYRIKIIRDQKQKLGKLVDEKTIELKLANEELQMANSTKDQLFSMIGHDLKSPFNTIIGFTDILAEDWNLLQNDEKLDLIKQLNQLAGETYQLLDNMLKWAILQKRSIKPMLRKVMVKETFEEISEIFSKFAAGKNIRIIVQSPESHAVNADTEMLNTIIRNLVSNAVKFTDKEGGIRLSSQKIKDKVILCVKDSGIGIPEEKIPTLFSKSLSDSTRGTEGEKGTGLGLTLCKEFVEMMGGQIWVNSEEGEGSEFCVQLPAI